jgi:hypothetical protein
MKGCLRTIQEVVSFHYDDQVYFNIAKEIVEKTVMVMSTGSAVIGV